MARRDFPQQYQVILFQSFLRHYNKKVCFWFSVCQKSYSGHGCRYYYCYVWGVHFKKYNLSVYIPWIFVLLSLLRVFRDCSVICLLSSVMFFSLYWNSPYIFICFNNFEFVTHLYSIFLVPWLMNYTFASLCNRTGNTYIWDRAHQPTKEGIQSSYNENRTAHGNTPIHCVCCLLPLWPLQEGNSRNKGDKKEQETKVIDWKVSKLFELKSYSLNSKRYCWLIFKWI